jgi:asparagine synthase (glutamine-hydrolysing)
MCGIVGAFGNQISDLNEKEILGVTRHRGPDDHGIWSNEHIFLGHVRLSIQDTSNAGHQPMVSPDGRYILIYNGEIYNHPELRVELKDTYHQFKSTSDTETLLVGLINQGPGFIKRLNGIFAFAFYDSVLNKLIVARDHLGVKPLYYFQNTDSFAFASELKALLSFNQDFTLAPERLADYLTFLWCPGEGTPFNELKKLLPGHYAELQIKDGEIKSRTEKYYQIPFNGIYLKSDEKDLVDQLDEKLTKAVKRQLLSDVPVGYFLSGGLDSTLLVAMARKLTGNPLQCFTIETEVTASREGFTDDLSFAKKAAAFLDVKLEVVKADIDIVRDFDKMIWHLDEPQADPAPLNVYNIARKAKEMGYKVLIGGTGGDDLFSGYRRHQALQLEKYFQFLPGYIKDLLAKIKLNNSQSFGRRVNKVLQQLDKPTEQRLANFYSWLPKDRVELLFSEEYKSNVAQNNPLQYLKDLLEEIPSEQSWLNKMLYWELRSFLVDHNLNYTDKMGMAAGVEIRVPYLDLDLVSFACQLDPELKLKGNETKYILKKVAERYLPKEIIYRPKTGFGAPVRKWITEDMDEMINERLSEGAIHKQGIFNSTEVHRLIAENKAGKVDASYTIWSLLAISSWMKQFQR